MTLHTPRDGRSATAAQHVYDRLWQDIVAFDLPPGTVLSRGDLAANFSVSQTPVREALLMLEQDGLIRIYPQSRTVVRPIDLKQLYETHFLRVAAELEVIWRLVAARDTETAKRARAILQMQKALVGDIEQADLFNGLDREFHQTLFDGVGVGRVRDLLARRLGHLARCQRLDLPSKGKMQAIVVDHGAILAAIEAGDADAATRAMRRHLSGTINRIDLLRRDHPDHFMEEDP